MVAKRFALSGVSSVSDDGDWRSPWEGETIPFPSLSDVLKKPLRGRNHSFPAFVWCSIPFSVFVWRSEEAPERAKPFLFHLLSDVLKKPLRGRNHSFLVFVWCLMFWNKFFLLWTYPSKTFELWTLFSLNRALHSNRLTSLPSQMLSKLHDLHHL